jgi:hypothetical protein
MLPITEEASDSRPSNGELNDFQILEPYLEELNRHIAITASNNGIPYAEVYLDKGYDVAGGNLTSDHRAAGRLCRQYTVTC